MISESEYEKIREDIKLAGGFDTVANEMGMTRQMLYYHLRQIKSGDIKMNNYIEIKKKAKDLRIQKAKEMMS